MYIHMGMRVTVIQYSINVRTPKIDFSGDLKTTIFHNVLNLEPYPRLLIRFFVFQFIYFLFQGCDGIFTFPFKFCLSLTWLTGWICLTYWFLTLSSS